MRILSLGIVLFMFSGLGLCQDEPAPDAAEKAIQFANSPSALSATASALARTGQSGKAKQLLSSVVAHAKERYVCRFLVASAYAELGEKEQAFESLEQGVLQRST